MSSRRAFTRLSLLASVVALIVVVLGAYVRLSHAGLSCPDWPGCYGQLVVPAGTEDVARANQVFPERPLDSARAWKEMAHRYLAGLLGLVIALLALTAWRRRREPGQQVAVPVGLVALVVFQALLGMWTVTFQLKPLLVVGHLLGGMTTLALCWWVFLRHVDAGPPQPQRDLPRTLIGVAIAVVFLQITLGGWTSANYAALACVDFPLCHGRLWPDMDFGEGFLLWRGLGQSYEGGVLATDARVAIQMAHRLGALITLVYVGVVGIYLLRVARSRRLAAAAGVMLLALLAQVALGIGNVVLHLPLIIAVAHNAVAALLLLSTVAVYHMAFALEAYETSGRNG